MVARMTTPRCVVQCMIACAALESSALADDTADPKADPKAEKPSDDKPAGSPAPAQAKAPAPLGVTLTLTSTAQLQDVDQRTLMFVANGSYTLSSGVSVFGRLGWVNDHGADGSAVANFLIGASMPIALPGPFGLTVRAVVTPPVGTGGGRDADPAALRASLMATDWGGPMFAPNHLSLGVGARLSFGHPPVFAFVDSILYSATRLRGGGVDPLGPSVAFSATQAVVGYIASAFVFYGGLAQTRYWGNPQFLGNAAADHDDVYGVGGVGWTHAGDKPLHLGLLYGRSVDSPKTDRNFQIFELSIAVDF